MTVNEFFYLVGAMLDVEDPDQTDPIEAVVSRRMRAKIESRLQR